MDKELVELVKAAFRALPRDWRPALVMGLVAGAMVYGYYARIANPISEAHAAGINNTAAIKALGDKIEQRHQEDQRRLTKIENNQSEQNQQLKDLAAQQSIILQVLLTGQKPAPKPPRK
jgi:hypothetical protein